MPTVVLPRTHDFNRSRPPKAHSHPDAKTNCTCVSDRAPRSRCVQNGFNQNASVPSSARAPDEHSKQSKRPRLPPRIPSVRAVVKPVMVVRTQASRQHHTAPVPVVQKRVKLAGELHGDEDPKHFLRSLPKRQSRLVGKYSLGARMLPRSMGIGEVMYLL